MYVLTVMVTLKMKILMMNGDTEDEHSDDAPGSVSSLVLRTVKALQGVKDTSWGVRMS